MSKKSELAAMKYLADKRPGKYRLKHLGVSVTLMEYKTLHCMLGPFKGWELLHRVEYMKGPCLTAMNLVLFEVLEPLWTI